MDAISLIQTIIPLVVAIVFSMIAITDIKGIIDEKNHSVLAPVWCLLSFICWVGYGIVNLYATTTMYLAALAWLYIGIGLIFFPMLFFVALLTNIKVAGDKKEQHEMDLK